MTYTELSDRQKKQRNREEVALLQAEELMAQYDVLTTAEEAAKQAKQAAVEATVKFGDMLASALKIAVGTRVSVTKTSWRTKAKTTTKYEVIAWSHRRGANLNLRARQIRKDGSLGKAHTLSEWTRVA